LIFTFQVNVGLDFFGLLFLRKNNSLGAGENRKQYPARGKKHRREKNNLERIHHKDIDIIFPDLGDGAVHEVVFDFIQSARK